MNQLALVTGASRGIGRGIVLELAKIGFDVVINYSSNETAANQTVELCLKTAKENGKQIIAEKFQADISVSQQRHSLVQFIKNRFGKIDLLVNNAGVAPLKRADILEANEESFDRLININAKGPYFLTQLISNWMIELVSDNRQINPKIVFITSVSAYAVSLNRGDYCISKAALSMAAKLFAARLAQFGIPVYEVRPGIIDTDMTKPVKERYNQLINSGLTPIKQWGTPEHIGKAVAAIALGFFPFSTGDVINVDGGFHLRIL
ncbi:MAG TPA: 3-ketoacyl-ACP reductase [Verrucomicrobiota bacterium]|nr:3-ketoacyl-ACP reductase [Verrucomicrobiota bacterium]